MSLAQIQLYINEKNWNELAKVILDIGYDGSIRFTREFLDEFLLSRMYDYIFTDKSASSYKVTIFFKLLFVRLKFSNIELSKDDYLKIIKLAGRVKSSKLITRHFEEVVGINSYKTKEYVKLFLDPSFIRYIKSIYHQRTDFYFSKKHFDGLTPEEARTVLKNILEIHSGNVIKMDPEEKDPSVFAAIASTPEELLEMNLTEYGINKYRDITNLKAHGCILKDIPVKKYKELINKIISDDSKSAAEKYKLLENLISYQEYNSEKITYTDKELEKFKEIGEDLLKIASACFTFEQYKKYVEYVDVEILINNRKISIKQIGEIYSDRYVRINNISNYKFVREEEILESPHLFDPSIIKRELSVFCSEETFNVLNKKWNKKIEWDQSLVNFKNILSKNIRVMNNDDFRYLISKAKPSDEEIIESIIRINDVLDSYSPFKKAIESDFYKNFRILGKFLKKTKKL